MSAPSCRGRYVVGIDGGTESLRACVYDLEGRPLGSASAEYPTNFPRPSWAEQDPEDWWSAIGAATRQALAASGLQPEAIAAISVDTTCCTVVALTADGGAVRPALLWMDMRSAREAAEISRSGDRALQVNSGGRGPVSAEWMVPKALWLKRNEPENFQAAAHVCEYQDFINWRLTGQLVACLNNASIRWHYSVAAGWPKSLLQRVGLEELLHKWPQHVVAPGQVVGGLTEAAAAHLGLREGTLVAQGGADAFIGMLGLGVVESGQLALLTGSSHLHLGCTDRTFHGAGIWGTYQDAVLPGVNIVEGGQTSTGSTVAWFKRLLGPEVTYEDLNAEAALLPPGAEGLLVLDHFQGNRTPHTDPLSRGALTGLTLKHGRAHIFRALMEAVALGTHEILATMRTHGYTPTSIAVAGGATRSPLWLQIHADVANLPLVLTRVADAPMLGCAILAAAAAGLHPDISTAVQHMVHVERVVQPDAQRHQEYQLLFQKYQSLYPALVPIFHDNVEGGAGAGSTAAAAAAAAAGDAAPAASPSKPAAPMSAAASSGLDLPPLPPCTPASQPILSASILAADFANLGRDAAAALSAGANWIHVDMFDGTYVDNFTIGPPVLKSLRASLGAAAFLDCHLAVKEPGRWVAELAAAGASSVTFHIEVVGSQEQAAELAASIRQHGMRAGIALAPSTPASAVEQLLQSSGVDLVLCMTVEPGFGGQKLLPSVLDKVQQLRRTFPDLNIQVDGGVNQETAASATRAGANIAVAGSAAFGSKQGLPAAVSAIQQALAEGRKQAVTATV